MEEVLRVAGIPRGVIEEIIHRSHVCIKSTKADPCDAIVLPFVDGNIVHMCIDCSYCHIRKPKCIDDTEYDKTIRDG